MAKPIQSEGLDRRQLLLSSAVLGAVAIVPGFHAAQPAPSGKIQRCKVLVNEASLSRLFKQVRGRNVGILTATKNTHTADTNLACNKNLRWEIRERGFGVLHVQGSYIERIGTPAEKILDTEHSYVLVGKDGNDSGNMKGFLRKTGKQYDQEAMIYKPHGSSSAQIHYLEDVERGHDSKNHQAGDVYSLESWNPRHLGIYFPCLLLEGNKAFTFPEVQVSEKIVYRVQILTMASPMTFMRGRELEFI